VILRITEPAACKKMTYYCFKKGARPLLVALYQNQYVDMLSGITKDQWKTKTESGDLKCPVCKNPVTPKCGTKKTWHFAHSLHTDCESFHETETNYHLLGKKSLYKLLLEKGAVLELYIKEISQRPDLFLPEENQAIEFQCASMDPEIFSRRIRGYQSIQINSDWIFGLTRLKKGSDGLHYIQSADLTAAKKDLKGKLYLNYFCPLQQKFIVLRNIVPLTSTKMAAQSKVLPLKSIASIEELKAKDYILESLKHQWNNQKKLWRKTIFKNNTSGSLYVKKILYLNHKSLTLTSPLAGMPTSYFYHFETNPYIWQSYLLFFILRRPQTFSFDQIEKEFSRLIQKQVFLVRHFPYLNENYIFALRGYLEYLISENFLTQLDEYQYSKTEEIPFPQTLDEAFQLDKIFSERGVFFDFA
jgi:competence protein CoiA